MSFIETRFPDKIAYKSVGGPVFRTAVVETTSGKEYTNSKWAQSMRKFDLAHTGKTKAEIDEIVGFFEAVAFGRANMFRFKDWADYLIASGEGFLGTGFGTGGPTYQLRKRRTFGAYTRDKDIKKPVAGSVAAFRNASPITFGGGAGNISIDTTTGIITFVADASQTISTHTPGASHVFTTASDITGLINGSKVYITGVTGTAAAVLNGVIHSITGKSGAGPYTWTISTTTTGLTASGGTGAKYPQPADALTATGEYDVPVRSEQDELMISVEAPGVYWIDAFSLVERRV